MKTALKAGLGIAVLVAAAMAAVPAYTQDAVNENLVEFPLPKGEEAYAGIDGKRMWQWVVDQAKIARDFRDAGHPQYWGRLVSTSADEADVKWLMQKYKELGLTDTKLQTMNYYDPQWLAKSFSVPVTAGGNTTVLESAQPPYASTDTGGKELDLEVVYVGLGTANDFAGRDVKGKAVLAVYARPTYQLGSGDTLKLAKAGGAAAILTSDRRGGNYKLQSYRAESTVPSFKLGTKDSDTLEKLIASGARPHVKIKMEAETFPNAHSYLVWGTLPGMTDETIYVIAHRDGFFDAAGDNASGVAAMLGLVEHYAKVPKEQRRRTMIFIGTEGHHNNQPGGFGREWLAANRDRFFTKTALMINMEHPAEVLTHELTGGATNVAIPVDWYAGSSSRPALEKLAGDAFHTFGVPVWDKPSQRPASGDLGRFYWFLPGLVAQSNEYINMHTDADSPATVSWAGLQAITRAHAKIIDGVNKMALADLQRPAGPPLTPGIDLKGCEEWLKDPSKNCKK